MKALVLAAGEGTRLRPLTVETPKPLLLVGGKPLLTHSLEALREAGVSEVVLVIGHCGNQFRQLYRDGSDLGLKIDYVEQRERKGTAHAIGMGEDFFDAPFFCLAGDVLVSAEDLLAMRARLGDAAGTVMSAAVVDDPRPFGVLTVEDGMLQGIEEKPQDPKSLLINSSIYLMRPSIFDFIRRTELSRRGEYEITDSLQIMSREEGVAVHQLQGPWMDIGRAWDLLDANKLLLEGMERRIEGDVEEGCYLHGPVIVEAGARIRSGSYIEGPVYISAGCDIGPNCYIRAHTCLGPGCRVGNGSEVKNSLIMEGSKVPHLSYVGDSVIGRHCNLGAGTVVANLRFDGGNIKVKSGGQEVDSGRRKLGAIIGDRVQTGINSTVSPGTVIHQNAMIGPGARAQGEIGPDSFIR